MEYPLDASIPPSRDSISPEFVITSSHPSLPTVAAAANATTGSQTPRASSSGSDTLEEIDDPSRLLSKPLDTLPLAVDPGTTQPASVGSHSHADGASGRTLKRTLPNGFHASGSSSGSHFAQANGRSVPVWQPSQRNSSAPQGLVVSGSGARVPTQFLDASGSFPHDRTTSTTLGPNVTHGIYAVPSTSANALAGPSRAPQNGHGQHATIDLTGDDDDEDEDDEPVIISSKRGNNSDVTVDEARSNAIVCLGLINSMVLCMYGLPQSFSFTGDFNAEPPSNPAFEKANWPGGTTFYTEKGYRPVAMTLDNLQPPGRTLPPGYGHIGGRSEIKVGAVQPPLLAYPQLPPEEAKKLQPKILRPFGTLAEKYNDALEPLLRGNRIRCEARCRMVSAGRAGGFLHAIEILVFARRPDVVAISERLASHGIQLDHPANYVAEDYPTAPEYSNPHNPPPGGFRADQFRNSYTGLYRGSTMGTILQDRQATEQQKKEQVDTIYASIRSGEELDEVEPKPVIKSKLFQHQKQALGFLLEREKERHWSELGKVKSGPAEQAEKSQNGDSKNGADEKSISLWEVRRDSRGKVAAWKNLITQREVTKRPRICRGAILADDMGLGKTITTISLVAQTIDEAKAFGKSALVSYPPPDSEDEDAEQEGDVVRDTPAAAPKAPRKRQIPSPDTDDVVEDDGSSDEFTLTMHAAPPPKKKAKTAKSPKRKVSKSKKDPEAVRQQNLVCRSRATLIVCPLSIVANWEEQIREHWDQKRPPSIYIYHGGSRLTDPRAIANHDIVITTFPTLGTEFSNQSVWTADEPPRKVKATQNGIAAENGGGNDDDPDDDDEAIISVDSLGVPIDQNNGQKGGKRKKRAKTKESFNPLQRIEWFRIVLDEAHSIKGTGTWQSKAVCNLSAQRRLCLTGTPIQNGTDDLYALIKFLRLEPFTDRAIWNEFCGHKDGAKGLQLGRARQKMSKENNEPIDSANLGHIQIIMKLIALRRTKETKRADGEPILSLPPKYFTTRGLEFEPEEKARYVVLHDKCKDNIEEMMQMDTVNNNYATILHEILILRLACDHPSLVDDSRDAKRRANGGDIDVLTAIREDGLNRERAAGLFKIFADSDAANCYICQRDLSSIMEPDAAAEFRTNAAELDDALRAASEEGAKPFKKAASNGISTSASSTSGLQSPDESSMGTPQAISAVVTKCQHLFCSDCFRKHAGPEWPHVKAPEPIHCPVCPESLRLLLDAIQLEASDFAELAAMEAKEEDEQQGSGGKMDPFNDDEIMEEEEKDELMSEAEGGKKEEDIEETIGDGQTKKASTSDTAGHPMLAKRRDLSSKTRALISDLIPFSQCNPHSKLFKPDAPRLVQVATGNPDVPVEVHEHPPEQGAEYEPVKSVVFSQWTKMLDRIGRSLRLTGIAFARLDGTMSRTDRSAALERFKMDPGCEVLLVSLRAGGTGLNLVQACRAYLMDPYWNPAVENQGLDRVHRMGQHRPVITVKYVMQNSIEQNMLDLQKRKTELAERVGSRRDVSTRRAERKEELSILLRN